MSDIHYLSLLDISERIRRRELSSAEVTQALLDRIARLDGRLHSCLLVMADEAMAQARAADAEIAAGQWRGPLHGVPIGIKDLLWMKGLPTTAGMAILRDFRPEEDATVVERLREAGAVLIAKLHMTEGASLDHHPAYPRPVNPWSVPHWTGVSSSGSGVATAAGLCFAAIGSDTGGSIRMPSSANNLTGIKPTWGRVSRHGLIPLAESLDHLGPMARSAADAAAVLQAIAGVDHRDPTGLPEPVPNYLGQMDQGIAGLRLGIDWEFAADGMAKEIVDVLESALNVLQRAGVQVYEVKFPWRSEMVPMALFAAEMAFAHAAWFPELAERYGPVLRQTLEQAAHTRGIDVATAYIFREGFRGQIRTLFCEVDLLLIPGLGRMVPTWDEMTFLASDWPELNRTLMRFTAPFNLSGTPTISLPAGFTDDGLPIGIQLAGPRLSEPALIRAGVAFQKETDFHLRHPPLD